MGSRYLLASVVGLLVIVNCATALSQWDFHFGTKENYVIKLFEKQGKIGPFSYRQSFPIEVPVLSEITFVQVSVWSLSPPKVDYDEASQTVSINFSSIQITNSSYKIEAYGIRYIASEEKKG
ncbi:uncharacterized protein LOC125232934 [Leguminivora glycinivorella]|uniref:uncharacterized protein LOC125232934 n=1 Tax=Leguminivora glycinivorella TaxID=1035111 RepID=UPI00200D3F71|nr:uncharacterized protein LOC125232934 [Leguminivora glycinivorella]